MFLQVFGEIEKKNRDRRDGDGERVSEEIRGALVPVVVKFPAMCIWISRSEGPGNIPFFKHGFPKVWVPGIHGRRSLQA